MCHQPRVLFQMSCHVCDRYRNSGRRHFPASKWTHVTRIRSERYQDPPVLDYSTSCLGPVLHDQDHHERPDSIGPMSVAGSLWMSSQSQSTWEVVPFGVATSRKERERGGVQESRDRGDRAKVTSARQLHGSPCTTPEGRNANEDNDGHGDYLMTPPPQSRNCESEPTRATNRPRSRTGIRNDPGTPSSRHRPTSPSEQSLVCININLNINIGINTRT